MKEFVLGIWNAPGDEFSTAILVGLIGFATISALIVVGAAITIRALGKERKKESNELRHKLRKLPR